MSRQYARPCGRPDGGLFTTHPPGTAGSQPMNLKSPNDTSRSNCGSRPRLRRAGLAVGPSFVILALWLAGCAHAPIGADRVTPRLVYQQVGKSAVESGTLSADTVSLLHRHDLGLMVLTDPEE